MGKNRGDLRRSGVDFYRLDKGLPNGIPNGNGDSEGDLGWMSEGDVLWAVSKNRDGFIM
jgi:hypothetical protein